MKNKKFLIIILLCIFFFSIGYWISNLKKDHKGVDPKETDNPKKIFYEPNDLEGYWVDDKNQAFKITKKGSKYVINIGYHIKYAYTYKGGKISDHDTTFTRLEEGNEKDKFTGLWQGEKKATATVKYIAKVNIENIKGKYIHKIWSSVDKIWTDNDWNESVYIKNENKLNFYLTYKSTSEYTWNKKDGSLENSFDKYIYGKKNKHSIILPTTTTGKRRELEIYKSYTKVN